jgi:hypothetical protein
MQDHFFHLSMVPPNLVDRKLFQPTDHVLVQSTGSLGGNQTHDIRLTILGLDYLASGGLHEDFSKFLVRMGMTITRFCYSYHRRGASE